MSASAKENLLKRKIRERAAVFLSFVRLPEPGLVEILGCAGLDGVVIDLEHGSIGWTELERMIFAAYANSITPVVRVACNSPEQVGRALDLGAQGILAPHIRSGDDAAALRRNCLYAPAGNRGVGIGRPARWGKIPAAEYLATANGEVLIGAMIEETEAVDAIDAIAPQVDFLFFGTADMATSAGHPGEFAHAAIVALGARTIEAAERHGVPTGFPARDLATAQAAIVHGYRMISFGSAETLLFQHARSLRNAVQGFESGTAIRPSL